MIDFTRDNPVFVIDREADPAPLFKPRDPRFHAAAAFLNDAARGLPPFRNLAERLCRRESLHAQETVAAYPANEEDITEADREWWRRAGVPLEDPYAISYPSVARSPSIVPATLLIEAFEQLLSVRQGSADTWLFRYDPIWWQPAPGERERMERLEQRAASLTRQNRSAFLDELAAAGLFSPIFYMERPRVLREWGFERLWKWATAGQALLGYLQSWPRQRRLESPVRTWDVNQSPVDIAIFHDPDTPWPETDRDAWLADLEAALADAPPGPESGELIAEAQGRRYRVGWHRPGGRAVLEWIRHA